MKEFYKLYIGEAVKSGLPQKKVSYGIVTKDSLIPRVKFLAGELSNGQDLYIVGDSIRAYKRDKLHKFF